MWHCSIIEKFSRSNRKADIPWKIVLLLFVAKNLAFSSRFDWCFPHLILPGPYSFPVSFISSKCKCFLESQISHVVFDYAASSSPLLRCLLSSALEPEKPPLALWILYFVLFIFFRFLIDLLRIFFSFFSLYSGCHFFSHCSYFFCFLFWHHFAAMDL